MKIDPHKHKEVYHNWKLRVQEGTEADFLEACADKIIIYKDFEDLKEKLKR